MNEEARMGKQFTGRQIVLLAENDIGAGVKELRDRAGLKLARSADFKTKAPVVPDDGGLVLDELGVVVVSERSGVAAEALGVSASNNVLAVEAEQVMYYLHEAPSIDYLRGVRDVAELMLRGGSDAPTNSVTGLALDESAFTWGLQASRVSRSTQRGKGIRIAILDTGVDEQHPDLVGRGMKTKSFVPNEEVQDLHGHGTHCVGVACGPRTPASLPRYGVACEAEIYVGKVLSNAGSGADGSILAGMNWAIANRCRVISMSLGAPVEIGEQPSTIYEEVGRRAMQRGTLVVAAAGNESRRPNTIRPVGRPANCRTILSVGAVDSALQPAWFSSAGLTPGGGEVDLSGPGVDVHSSWTPSVRYRRLSGTSMAAPHVAGVAALWAEALPHLSPSMLWRRLLSSARPLPFAARDVGAGLVQAP